LPPFWDSLCGLIAPYRDGGGVAPPGNELSKHGKSDSAALRGLLKVCVWQCRDDALSREVRLIDYEL
jgi:hypothetical protein